MFSFYVFGPFCLKSPRKRAHETGGSINQKKKLCRNTYSALNAVAGHYNSFGADTPLPKKRFDRVVKELDDADKLLARGR